MRYSQLRSSIETEKQHATEETATEVQTEQITEVIIVEDVTTEPVEEKAQTVLEEHSEYETEQNTTIEEQTSNEDNIMDEYVMAGLDVDSYNYKEIFANSVVMGDSISEGLVSFDMLNSSSVIAKVGVSLTALDGALATVTQLSPQNVFLYYGLNDVGHVKYDYDRFRNEYESFVIRLKEALPNANIYANLLFPVNDWTLIGPWYENLDPYNEVIADVCMQYGIVCLDNRDIVREEYYVSDGYHFNKAFYPQWLYRMAIGAGLIQ